MEFTGERLVPGKVDLELEVEHMNRYIFAQSLVNDKKVLDAACGLGYGSEILAEKADKVFGVDISEDAILYAKNNYRMKNLDFKVADIEKLPFENDFFDVVVSFETIEHIDCEKQKSFLSEIKRVLKDDGLLVISTPNREVYKKREKNQFHVAELSVEEFKQILDDNFRNVQLFCQKFEVGNIIASDKVNWSQFFGRVSLENSEYIVALCSQEDIPKDINNIVNFYKENKYSQIMDWAIENHERNEKNNEKFKENYSIIKNLKDEILDLDEKNDKLERNLIAEQVRARKIKCELERVYASRGHKMLKKLYKLEGLIIPPGSRRRFVLKFILKTIRHPIVYLRKLNLTNIKKFFLLILRGNIYTLNEKLDILDNKKCVFVFEPVDLNQTEFEKLRLPFCDDPLVSIVIPAYNQFHYTYNCIKSIINHTRGIKYEVILADDVSTDKTKEIENVIENLKIIRNEKNLGFLLNCNNAANFAKGKYILFLNNDTSVQRGWLSSLLNLIENDKSIGLVGSKLVYPTGLLQESGGILWNDASAWNYGNGKDPMLAEFNYVKEVDYISGASIMVLKSLWDEIGGFDTRFTPAYYEDSDLAFEVRKHGYKVVYQPESVVVHFEGISNGTDMAKGVKSYQVANKNKFYEKWKEILKEDHFENGKNVFLARDRSKNKKCILFIDHYVPTFDRDAGSRATYQHLKLMAKLGYNIKFIGDNFLKYEKYTKALEDLGIEVLYGQKYALGWKNWIKDNSEYIDTVVLSRPHISKKYIDFVRKNTKAKIVYYVHDLHFLREFREYEVTKNPKLKSSSEYWKEIELDLMSKSDVVVTFSSYEKKIIDEYFSKDKSIVVPIFIFNRFDYNPINLLGKKDILFVGGFNHRPNEDAVIWFVKQIWPSISNRVPECKFIIVGSNPTEKVKSLASKNIIVTGFVTDEELKEYYSNCRVCVIPLRYGAGVKGKTIEAIYNKIPIVSTSIGVEGLDEIENYISVANNSEDFVDKVLEYYENDKLVADDVLKYHEYLNKYFSEEHIKKIFKSLFEGEY